MGLSNTTNMMWLILWKHKLSLHPPICLLSWNCNLLKWFKHITFNKRQRKRLELLPCNHNYSWFLSNNMMNCNEIFSSNVAYMQRAIKLFTLVKTFGYKSYLNTSDLMFYFHLVHNLWKNCFLLGHQMYKHACLTKSYNFNFFKFIDVQR
jgi:hypothetical protein